MVLPAQINFVFRRFLPLAFIGCGSLMEAQLVTASSDTFGHSVASTAYNLRDLPGGGLGTLLDISDEDDAVTTVVLGFDFEFYGETYSEVEISTNGYISFTIDGPAGCCGEPIPTFGQELDHFIAGYWTDLNPNSVSGTGGGEIYQHTSGSVGQREFIVGFYDVLDADNPTTSSNTFEIILHESTNDIELQFEQLQFDSVEDVSVGIENIDGSDGIELLDLNSSASGFMNGDIVVQSIGVLITIPEPSSLLLVTLSLPLLVRRRRAGRLSCQR